MGVSCEVCGAKCFFVHSGTRDNPSIDVYECPVCHTKQLNFFGENNYSDGFMNGHTHMTEQEIAARLSDCKEDDVRRARMLLPWIEGKDILDFGSGFGGFISLTLDKAKSVSGVELSRDELNYSRLHNFDVKEDLEQFDACFDVITLFHVFEHLANPREWLSKFSKKLNKDGRLFIEVPNSNDALLSLYKCSKFADFTYWSAHLYLYTRESLRRLIEDNGEFVIESEEQVQRYPISNHLYWLSNGGPGGQNKWTFLNSDIINEEYKKLLENNNMCDTLFFRIRKKS